MNKSQKYLLLGAGIASAGAVVVTALSYKYIKGMIDLALDREEPKRNKSSHTKVSGQNRKRKKADKPSESDIRLGEYIDVCRKNLESCKFEEIEITSRDGTKLAGYWYPCENPKRVIIAMHGWRSSWKNDFSVISHFWHDNDSAILFADQRGQGMSGGEYMGFGLVERYDCSDWVYWVNESGKALTKNNQMLPIYLAGISMGASTVLMTAGLELPENVHGVIADCGFTSPHDIWKHVVEKNLHIPYTGITGAIANDLCRKKLTVGSNDYSTVEAMKTCTIPVLLIHGTEDKFVPIEMTYKNYSVCTAPKRLLVVPGAEHGRSFLTDRDAYEKAVLQFWKDFD